MNNEKKLNIKLMRIIFLCFFALATCLSLSGCDLFNSRTTSYTIYAYANNSNYGTVSGSGEYGSGIVATITATPYSGYKFVKWNDYNQDNPRSICVTQNLELMAYFESTSTGATYSIVVNSNNRQYGTVTGSGTYNAGQTITITATPTQSGNFVNWDDGNTSASRTITVDSDKTYTANFESKYIEITVKNLDSNFDMTSIETYTVLKNSTGTYTLKEEDSFFSYWVENSYYVPISTLTYKNFSETYHVSTAQDVDVYCVHSRVGEAAYISTSSDCDNVADIDTIYNRTRSDNFIAYYYSGTSKYLHRGDSVDNTDTSKLLLSNYTNHTNYVMMNVFKAPIVQDLGGSVFVSGYTEYVRVKTDTLRINPGASIRLYLPSIYTLSTSKEYVAIV